MKHSLKLILSIVFLYSQFIVLSQNIRIIPPVGHTAQITDVEISEDGKYILSSSVDKTIILWDYISGREIVKLSGTDFGATCCVFDDKNNLIYSAGWDGIIRKWDIKTLKEISQWQAYTNGVNNIELLPENKAIASIGKDGVLKIWDTKNETLLKEIKVSNFACDAIDSNKKSNLLAIGDQGGNLILINTKDYKIIKKIKLHDSFITSVCFSKNGKTITTGSYDYKIKITDTKDYSILHEITDQYQTWSEISISPDATKLAAISLNGSIYEWNLENEKQLLKVTTGFQMGTALAYNPDASEIIACGATNDISVFRSIEGKKIKSFTGYTSSIESIDALSNKMLIASVHWDSRIRLFDMYKCKLANSAFIDSNILSDVILSRNSDIATISGMSSKLKTLDYNKDIISNLFDIESGINAIAQADDESMIAVANRDSSITVFNQDEKAEIFKIKHNADVMDICFSHDNNFIYSVGRDSTLIVSNTTVPYKKQKIKLKSKAESVAISSDNNYIAVGLWTGEIAIVETTVNKILKYINPHKWIVSDLSFSPINDYLLSASWDKNLVITDWQNEIETSVYSGHTGSITSAKHTDDGKYIISGGWDNQIKILDSRNLEEICTIIPIDKEDYLIFTPDMYYMGTSDAAKKVSFANGLITYSFEQFDLQYNRPDKVIESLPFANKDLVPLYKKAYDKRLEKTGFKYDFFEKSFNAPEIRIKNIKNIDLYTDKKTVNLEIYAIDTVYFIDRYNIYVNGVSIFGSNGKNTRKQNKYDLNIREEIKLSEGLNHIEVSAMNSAGVESLRQSIEIFYSPESEIKKNIYIISMAVAEYDNSAYNLSFTTNDGRAIVETFKDMSTEYNIIVDTLFNENCTRNNFSLLRNKLLNTNVDDIVIIHFSGHGLLDSKGDFYFATYDINFSNPSENGLEYDLIEGVLDGIPARNKLILLDACHSGELDIENVTNVPINNISETAQNALAAKGVVMYNVPVSESNDILENSFDLMMNYFADVRKGTGAVVISAATGSGFALEISKLKHGVFTYVLLQGLKDKLADENGDSEISVYELRKYLFQNVVKVSDGFQKPTSRKDNLINDFIIYK